MASGKRDPQALATELFARLDAARGSLGGTLPRAAAIATAAAFIVECCLPKRKSNSFAGMTDQEFKEYLLNTYTWLDVERELTKCSAWVRINIQGSTGPTRKRIINWFNKADSKPMSGSKEDPIDIYVEPAGWRAAVRQMFPDSNMFEREWAEIRSQHGREIIRYMRKNGIGQ